MKVFLEIVTHPAFIWSLSFLIVSGLALLIISYFVASRTVYKKTMVRISKETWGREHPSDLAEETVAMYEEGLAWAEQHQDKKVDLHIVNRDGYNLYGEYYDFGSDKCAFILSGRTEALRYGYYFAKPYSELGYSILVIDPRAHGLSDGTYNTMGFEESKDDIEWINYVTEKFNLKTVVLHGICIGAAGGVLALTSENAPSVVKGIVTEGMFANFYESFKNHLIERKKPVFIMMDLVNNQAKKHTGYSMKYGPINVIDKLDRPIMMLQSKEDIYSTPEFAQKLYEKAGSKDKELVLFEKGKHSMLRLVNTELYDKKVKEFASKIAEQNK